MALRFRGVEVLSEVTQQGSCSWDGDTPGPVPLWFICGTRSQGQLPTQVCY